MKNLTIKLLLLMMCLMIFCAAADSAVIHVKLSGNDANDGLSWDQAKGTIQAAVNAAADGDQIWVARGTCNGSVTVDKPVSMYGGFTGTETELSGRPAFPRQSTDRNETILQGSSGSYVVTIQATNYQGSSILINGFSIQGGGGGIYGNVNCNIDITNCKIKNNLAYGNKTIWAYGSPGASSWCYSVKYHLSVSDVCRPGRISDAG